MELAEINFKHSTPIQIRFNDIDGLGHVNNAVQAGYFDYGRMRYFELLTGGPIDWEKFSMVIASVHTEFKLPIFLHETIEVNTSVYKIGNKSLKMIQTLVDDKGLVKSLCKSVMVGVDFKTGSSTEITNEIRSLIEAFER